MKEASQKNCHEKKKAMEKPLEKNYHGKTVMENPLW